jgi:hypothetical protein
MWTHLRAAILYYMRVQKPENACNPTCGHEHLQQFARLAKRHAPRLCTFQLHQCLCRLPDQERARGATAYNNELWVERALGPIKDGVRYRTKQCPAVLAVNILSAHQALAMMRAKALNHRPMLTMWEWVPSISALTIGVPSRFVDIGSPDGAQQCLFLGKALTRDEVGIVVSAARTLLQGPMCPPGWAEEDARAERMTVFLHRRAPLLQRAWP